MKWGGLGRAGEGGSKNIGQGKERRCPYCGSVMLYGHGAWVIHMRMP